MSMVLNKTDRLVFFMTAKRGRAGKGRRAAPGTEGETPIAWTALVSARLRTGALGFAVEGVTL